MSPTHSLDEEEARQALAAEWVLRLNGAEARDQEVAEWLAWIEADPANRIAFEGMAELWMLSGDLPRDALPAAIVPQAANDRWKFRWAAALAASLMLMLGGAWLLRSGQMQTQNMALETPVGILRETKLADGSQVEMGGRTTLSVKYTAAKRLILAGDGEAFYKVAKNHDRPFVVQAGPLTITAVGTAFSVQREGDSVSVDVTEGVVEIQVTPVGFGETGNPRSTIMASAGHRIRFDRGELTQSLQPAQVDIFTPWREGRLEFRDEPLRLVVARINRYAPYHIEIADRSIEDLRVTTTVYQDRVDIWLRGIEAVLPVRISRKEGGDAVITPAQTANRSAAERF